MKFQNSTASWQPLHCIVPGVFVYGGLGFFFWGVCVLVLVCLFVFLMQSYYGINNMSCSI